MFIDRYDVPYTECVGIVLIMLCLFDHGIDTCIQSKRSQCALWPQQKPPMWWSQQKQGAFRAFTGNDQACGRKPEMLTTKDQHTLLSRGFQARVNHGAMARRVSLQIFKQDFLRFLQLACIIVRKKGICFPQCSPSFGDACQLTGTGQKPYVLIEPWWGSFCSAFLRLDSGGRMLWRDVGFGLPPVGASGKMTGAMKKCWHAWYVRYVGE